MSQSRKQTINFSRSFSFDPNGNRLIDSVLGSLTYLDDQILSSPTMSYIPDPTGQGQLAGTDSSLKSESFQYGVNGKIIQYQAQKKLCNNRPCSELLTAKYLYDGLGRRLQKQIQRSWDSDVIVQNYAYLSDRDVIFLAKNGDADLEDNAHPLTLLVDNQGSTARLSDHLGEVSGKNTTPYKLDHLGSVINSLAADFASNPLSGYGAFGESSHASIDETTPAVVYGFAGGEYDFESGRYYLRARIYDPQSARFLTKDPLGPHQGGDINPYRYVMNNPVNMVDPLGLWGLSLTTGWSAGASYSQTSTQGQVIEGSSGIALGTQGNGLALAGVVSRGDGTSINGIGASMGMNLTVFRGDVSSNAGVGTATTYLLGPFSGTVSRDASGQITSLGAGVGGKGLGIGSYTTDTTSSFGGAAVNSNGGSLISGGQGFRCP